MAWFLHFSSSYITFTYPIFISHCPHSSSLFISYFAFWLLLFQIDRFRALQLERAACFLLVSRGTALLPCIWRTVRQFALLRNAPRRKTFPRYLPSSVRNRCPLSVVRWRLCLCPFFWRTLNVSAELREITKKTRARTETRLVARVLILRRNECSCVWTTPHLFLLIFEQKIQKKFFFQCYAWCNSPKHLQNFILVSSWSLSCFLSRFIRFLHYCVCEIIVFLLCYFVTPSILFALSLFFIQKSISLLEILLICKSKSPFLFLEPIHSSIVLQCCRMAPF